MKLIILASGRGSRLNKLTSKIPKCLVKVNKKPILNYLKDSFQLFDETVIITGYRSNVIKKKFKQKITFVKNEDYMKTNMVHSLFCASHLIDDDIIVAYSDIIFDKSILKKLIKCKKTTLPLNYLWLQLWKRRMPDKTILDDAEDVRVKNKKVIAIGGKIKKNMIPQMQFMGLMKIKKRDYFAMKKKYDEIRDRNIDFTTFINVSIQTKTIEVEQLKCKALWVEIDSKRDLKVAEQILKTENRI